MPLTAAEKQKRYREKVKRENPEKYAELQRKAKERSAKNYKKQMNDELKRELLRKKWKEARMKPKCNKSSIGSPQVNHNVDRCQRLIEIKKPAKVYKKRKAPAQPSSSPTPSTSSRPGSNRVGSSKRGGGSKQSYRRYISSLGSSSSKDNQNTLHISQLVVPQCRLCAQFNMDCIDLCTDNGDSVKNNITIVFNEISVVVDLNSRELPKTVCRQCDLNLQDMYKFVNQVHAAQASLIRVYENVDERLVIKDEPEEIEIDDSDDDDTGDDNEISTTNAYLNAMDDVKTVTDTELVPQTVLIPQRTVEPVQRVLIPNRTVDKPFQRVLILTGTVDEPVQTVLVPKRTVDETVQRVVIPNRTVDEPVQTVLVPKRTVDEPVQQNKEADKLVFIESGNSKLVIDSDVVKEEGLSDVDRTNLSIPDTISLAPLYRPSSSTNPVSDSVTELAEDLFKKGT